MNIHTDVQIIHAKDGTPAFVVVPYAEWVARQDRENLLIPNEVVNLVFDNNWSPLRAWREHLGLTQSDIAERMGVSQSAYAQMENTEKPRMNTLRKVAAALGVHADQLKF